MDSHIVPALKEARGLLMDGMWESSDRREDVRDCMEAIDKALEEARNLTTRAAEAEKDAARYRWIRANRPVSVLVTMLHVDIVDRHEALDAAIDAALSPPQEGAK